MCSMEFSGCFERAHRGAISLRGIPLGLPRFRGQLNVFEPRSFLASSTFTCERGVRGVRPMYFDDLAG
jgi:hypothetical protein